MNPEVKAQWLAALRSGQYQQGREALRNGDTFCCLGVLCELHRLVTGDGDWEPSDEVPERGYHAASEKPIYTVLPRAVADWAGIRSGNPSVDGHSLAWHNDGDIDVTPKSFNEVADLIEVHL